MHHTGRKIGCSFMRASVEVGTNTGSQTEQLDTGDKFLFTFEPSPILYNECVNKFKDSATIVVLPFAVDVHNSVKFFNVSVQGDRGFGSLYEFHDNIQDTELKIYEEFRVPFAFKQKVLTVRLDTFMNNWDIDGIDYLWIDAQGNDFNCIKSLGDRIKDVKEGKCECTWEIPLYNGPDNYYENVKKYLEDVGGFKVEVAYEHQHKSEIDLKFYR